MLYISYKIYISVGSTYTYKLFINAEIVTALR